MTFREEAIVICYLQAFLFAPIEFQSSFQVVNFVGVLLSRRNLTLITRDPFQPLKGLLKSTDEWLLLSASFTVKSRMVFVLTFGNAFS